jgi:hypothetical protein
MGVGVFLETMKQSSHLNTDLGLEYNPAIGHEGASHFAWSWAHPHFMRLPLSGCGIGDDSFTALMSALERSTSLRYLVSHLDRKTSLRYLVSDLERNTS